MVKKQSRYKTKKPDLRTILERYDKKPAIAGNISYKDLVNSQGDNFRVRLNLSAVPKLYAYPLFFSAKLYSDYALVTIKKRDKEVFKQILETGTEATIQKHNEYFTPRAEYQELKKRAKQLTRILFCTHYIPISIKPKRILFSLSVGIQGSISC